MTTEQLDKQLFTYTDREQYHLLHPDEKSFRYKSLESCTVNGQPVYIFTFNSVLKNDTIAIHKESRFTPIYPHMHSVIELTYVYSGACTQVINGKTNLLEHGDVCIMDTNTIHKLFPLGKNDIIISVVMRKSFFNSNFLSRLSSEGLLSNFLANAVSSQTNHKQYILFRSSGAPHFHHLMQHMMCEYFDKRLCSTEIIDSYMVIIFSELLRLYHKQQLCDSSKEKSQLISILNYISQNYENLTLDALAKTFNFHPNYLSVYLKQHTGKTFKELLIIQKMSLACFNLVNSDEPISSIANDIGYQNLSFFYRKFKDYYKMTPQEYRNRYRSPVPEVFSDTNF